MPPSDPAVLSRRDAIVAALRAIVPGEGVIAGEREMRPFESDGLTAYRQLPMVVVLPSTTQQVSQVLRYCHDNNIKVVPRGAGTSLSGGALPLEDGVLLGLSKFSRIREIDFDNRVVVAEPGVTNLGISNAVAHKGFYYAPDPSSQIACTIGGNIAENSGGVHCLKYGMTTNNVLGLEMVLMTGEILRIGGKHLDSGGYDLLGIVTGSEGLLGVVTEITVRILKKPRPRARCWSDSQLRRCRRLCRSDHRRGHYSGRHGDDGQACDPCGRGIRAWRLSARCRGAADRRTRWRTGRSRSPDRTGRDHREGMRRDHLPGVAERGRASAVLGRAKP